MMFRKMRRANQELSEEASAQILREGTSGILAVWGDDDYPYTVPLSYVYEDGKLYFHCATVGHKLDGIRRSDKVSFCVIAQDHIVPEEFTTYFKSVVVFGKARILEGDQERYDALAHIAKKYSPGEGDRVKEEIEKTWKAVSLIELSIEHMTGKAASELL